MKTTKRIPFHGKKGQRGNYLLSIGMGIMVMAILAVWGIPKIKDYLVEGAIPSVSEEVQRFIARVKVNTSGNGITPYTGLTQNYFAQSVAGSSLQTGPGASEGASNIVRHGLGGGTAGTIVLTNDGSTFTLTFNGVNQAACPALATSMQRAVDSISINSTAVKTTDTSRNVTVPYNASSAATHCDDGDVNTFAFTVQN